ncbi:hypothetical protein [Catellatospora tritici]|uniref:hypothetical protein n=1 Tax=Catellatospora tritici TaxID=2851566 RepID=UPI001C2DB06B|nr:hypothetical protein [Catellatospora tritici]MBV1849342.1 hypothetical protein [Catellatospora tritici]
MKMISHWWEWQRGWKLAVQLAAVAALLMACYVVGGYGGWLVGQVQARLEVVLVDSGVRPPLRPQLPPDPFLSRQP